jgi:hypothetical protein
MMRFPFLGSLRALVRPGAAFPLPAPSLGRAALDMALVWMPLALVNEVLTARQVVQAYQALRMGVNQPAFFQRFGLDPVDLQHLLASLPPPPAFGRIWPWLLVVAPLSVLGTWLHHAVWDHTGLWLLGGLGEKRGFRTSLLAEAEALRITAVGVLVGLLGFVPVLGVILSVPMLLLDGYLWLFRGMALAARHGCEPWRGIGATVVHAVLLGCLGLGLLSSMILLIQGVA